MTTANTAPNVDANAAAGFPPVPPEAPHQAGLVECKRLGATDFARRLRLGLIVMSSVGHGRAYAWAGDGRQVYAKDLDAVTVAAFPPQVHARILAVVRLGNNGWVYRCALSRGQQDLAEAAAEAGALRKVWRLLSGHPMQQAYALPLGC